MRAKVYIELKSKNSEKIVVYNVFTPQTIMERLEGVKFSFWGEETHGIWINNDDISSIRFEEIEEDDEQ